MIKITSTGRIISDGFKRVPYIQQRKTYQIIRVDNDGNTPWIENPEGRIFELPYGWKQ